MMAAYSARARALAFAGALCLSAPAIAALPEGVDCDSVRSNYATWGWTGKTIIRAWLRKSGYSEEQIAEAERCLPKQRRARGRPS